MLGTILGVGAFDFLMGALAGGLFVYWRAG